MEALWCRGATTAKSQQEGPWFDSDFSLHVCSQHVLLREHANSGVLSQSVDLQVNYRGYPSFAL